jgi:hypothetical protein
MRRVLVPVVVAVGACSSSAPPVSSLPVQNEIDDPESVTLTSADWNGEPIAIHDDSVDFVPGASGVRVVADSTATKVTAVAAFTAKADDGHDADARLSIGDAKTTFKIDGFAVSCVHGLSHGTSLSTSSGCRSLTVTVPAGDARKPLDLSVLDVNGGITLSGTPLVSRLVVQENGLGRMDIRVSPQPGATVTVRSGFDVVVALPAGFAADVVTLSGGQGTSAIDTSAFPGLMSGVGFGQKGAGAATLDVVTSPQGTIKLAKF